MGRVRTQGVFPIGLAAAAAAGLALAGCSSPSGPSQPPVDASIRLDGGTLLVFRDGGRLADLRGPIEAEVRRTLAAALPLLRVADVRIDVRAERRYAIPEIGFGGRADAGSVRLSFDTTSPHLEASLPNELFPLLSHELHHVARFRTVGFSSNLLEAMVTEGLADRFSVEVAGVDPPPWSSALSEQETLEWLARAEPVWLREGYDHDAWFFGTTGEIPRWTGYTLGFELVGRFLAAHPGRTPSDLIGEPALSFAATAP